MKILLAALCLAAALLPATVYAVRHLPHIQAAVSSSAVTTGQTFTVTLTGREMAVCSYTGGISFDNNILEVIEISRGDAPLYEGAVYGLSTAAEANASGRVGLYAIHSTEARYAGGTLATVRFRAKATGTAVLTPYENCDGTEAFWANAGRVEVSISAAASEMVSLTWRVVATGCDLVLRQGENTVWSQTKALLGDYSVPAASGAYTLEVAREGDYTRLYSADTASTTDIGEVCSLPWGDVNGSGETDAVDLQTLFEYLSTGSMGGTLTPEQFSMTADCNGDGAVNILDYQTLYENVVTHREVAVSAPVLSAAYATATDAATHTEMSQANLQKGG